MNYAVLATFDQKYMSKVIKHYTRARTRMIRKLKRPNGHLVITRDGFSSTCCREMYDSIIFKEVDLNYDYDNLFSSIRVDSMKIGKIECTDRCPFCGAMIEGIKVRLPEDHSSDEESAWMWASLFSPRPSSAPMTAQTMHWMISSVVL